MKVVRRKPVNTVEKYVAERVMTKGNKTLPPASDVTSHDAKKQTKEAAKGQNIRRPGEH